MDVQQSKRALKEAEDTVNLRVDWRSSMTVKERAAIRRNHEMQIPSVIKYKVGTSDVTFVGVEHTHDGNGNMAQSIKELVLDYISKTPIEKRSIVIEIPHDVKLVVHKGETFEDCVSEGAEPLGVIALAKNQSKLVNPDHSIDDTIRVLKENDFTTDRISLFFALRNVMSIARQNKSNMNGDITGELKNRHQYLKKYDLPIFKVGSERDVAESINRLCEANEIKRFFKLSKTAIRLGIDEEEATELIDPTSRRERGNKITNKVSSIEDMERNVVLLHAIAREEAEGKSPLVIYGNGHLYALKRALDRLFGKGDFKTD